jgi:hypothetical protein
MTRTADRRAARREARKRRAERRLFDAAWTFGDAFDTRSAPVLPGDSELTEVSIVESRAELEAAALHFCIVVPRPPPRRRRRRRQGGDRIVRPTPPANRPAVPTPAAAVTTADPGAGDQRLPTAALGPVDAGDQAATAPPSSSSVTKPRRARRGGGPAVGVASTVAPVPTRRGRRANIENRRPRDQPARSKVSAGRRRSGRRGPRRSGRRGPRAR